MFDVDLVNKNIFYGCDFFVFIVRVYSSNVFICVGIVRKFICVKFNFGVIIFIVVLFVSNKFDFCFGIKIFEIMSIKVFNIIVYL